MRTISSFLNVSLKISQFFFSRFFCSTLLAIAHTPVAFGNEIQGFLLESSRWTTNRIPVCWENGSPATSIEQNWVRNRVLATWDAASAISFIGWGNCNASTSSGVRILISDQGPHVKALGKYLNNVPQGMILNFTFGNWGQVCNLNPTERRRCIESNAIHEFGHALGISHEQNRPDTDRLLCADAPQGPNGDVIIGPFDYQSIMNYCFNSGYNNNLSATDRATINSMHPKQLIDFNGDGRTDIALFTATGAATTLPIAFSSGSGSFTVKNANVDDLFFQWAYQWGRERNITGDFNNDGYSDIALMGAVEAGSIPVAFSNGNGSFTVTQYPLVNINPIDPTSPLLGMNFQSWADQPNVKVIAGDFNGDGRSDIALTGGANWKTILVAFSSGNGNFVVTNIPVNLFATGSSTPQAKVISGDFNGDGRTDLALTNGSGWNTIPVAFSNGDGSFRVTSISNPSVRQFASWTAYAGVYVLSGDYNADGLTDLAIVGGDGADTLPVAFSRGNGTFNVTNTYIGSSFHKQARAIGAQVRTADFNGDARTDILIIGTSGTLSVPMAFSRGDGSWTLTNHPINGFAAWSANTSSRLILGDFNRNRSYDLALTGAIGATTLPVAFSSSIGNFIVTNFGASNFANWSSQTGTRIIQE